MNDFLGMRKAKQGTTQVNTVQIVCRLRRATDNSVDDMEEGF